MMALQNFLIQGIARSPSPDSRAHKRSILWVAIILGLWLVVVTVTAARHEFWRDEIRALSLARSSDSLLDLYRRTQYDGHPSLWFLLLYLGTALVDSPLVLPALSLTLAFAAVTLFMLTAPFALWIRGLIIFSALPLYEYSVTARNYGISMLLMILTAALYRRRAQHPLLMGVVLALLANTNVHSTILTAIFAGIWMWDRMIQRGEEIANSQSLPFWIAQGFVVGGIALSIIWAWPRQDTILTNVHRTLNVRALQTALGESTLLPGQAFSALMPDWADWSINLLLPLGALGLLSRPPLFLAALGAQVALGSFFQLAYWGQYRHQGLLLIFLISLYWFYVESVDTGRLSRRATTLFALGSAALLILIAGNVLKAGNLVRQDVNRPMSSSQAFGEFLASSPVYHDAIIVPEPAYLVESLPYYVPNRIYFPREGRFGTTVSWTTAASTTMSLGDLLSVARDLATQFDQPVLILYGHRARIRAASQSVPYSYNKVFAWTPEQAEDFKAATSLVGDFKEAVNDERYEIYALQ